MSKEFISRADLEFDFLQCNGTSPKWTAQRVAQLIHRQDNANVAQVMHGQWVGTADGYADGELVYDMWNCSECGYDADGAEEVPDWKFCPMCGARMDIRPNPDLEDER